MSTEEPGSPPTVYCSERCYKAVKISEPMMLENVLKRMKP